MKYYTMPLMLCLMVCAGCSGHSPKLGVTDGRLKPCPASPNCVNSQLQENGHAIAPIAYEGSLADARERLLLILRQTKRAKVVVSETDYIRAEFRSAIFRFVDDVEFYFPEAPVIHVRSASRVGYSDLGVNRKRVEKIREQFIR
jgi:uncharacterized protein (DUF1499 family)